MPVIITWNTPESPSPILGYRIYRRTGNQTIQSSSDLIVTVSATIHEYIDTTVNSLTLWYEGYTYGISAFNECGESSIDSDFVQFVLEENVWIEAWFTIGIGVETPLWTENWEVSIAGSEEVLWVETWDSVTYSYSGSGSMVSGGIALTEGPAGLDTWTISQQPG